MHLSLMISRRYINRLKLSLMHISLLAGIPEEFKVNIYIGWLFKLIPLIMGLICIALGGFVLESSGQSEYFVAGHVLISLAAYAWHYSLPHLLSFRSSRAALIRFAIHCSPLLAMRGQLSP